ncbi:sensor domain-containing phosphodiesterase [Marinobacter alexandrii]|uniref:sensor domain-containing phosphodiesterase n=1 Tax=Marinobacter alexandrii TaxID=2570351 RepID=UPI001108BC9F|nr:sensor domain-containing phosphodiesterase [Marinobacter alexandrii]
MKQLDETARLNELSSLNILDTPPEERFDRHTRLASIMFDVPTAFITFIDHERVWFKSKFGIEISEVKRTDSLCQHTLGLGFLEIEDTFEDELFRNHPAVKGSPPIRFYAASVLHGPSGQPVGTLCLVDYAPRRLSENERAQLEALARLVESEIERDRTLKDDWQILRDSTLRDSFTGLPGDMLLEETLEGLIRTAEAEQSQLAILHLHVENFDAIASLSGGAGWNSVVQAFVDRLVMHNEGILGSGRVAPDRLALVVPFDTRQSTSTMARRIMGIMTEPVEFAGRDLRPEISIGISVYPADGSEARLLIDRAQRACKLSPAQIDFYDPSEEANATRSYLIQDRLGKAIANHRVTLNYQPIWSADGTRVIKFEALARWQDEELGVVSPGEFVPIAEKHAGLSHQLTYYVLRMACLEARTWKTDPCHEPIRVAVNIPAAGFYQPEFAQSVLSLLREVDLEPSRLTLELTEDGLVQNIDHTTLTMRELSSQGIRLALDDFGTGYSSLNHLNQLPVDTLKIDKSIVDGLPNNRKSLEILSGFIRIAHAMELTVVAEGVEHETQRQLLAKLDCDMIQGYLLGRPITAGKVHELLTNTITDRGQT